jgi:DNA-binding MarR family transcriptional regulator
MSQVLDRQEDVKYIQRKPSPDDKRKTLVTLTKTGKNLVQEIYDEREEYLCQPLPLPFQR